MPSNATPIDPILGEIWHVLASSGDPEKALKQQAYMKSALPFRGISSPELAAVLKPILASWAPPTRASWEATIRTLWGSVAYREEWYAALALVRHRRARPWLDADAIPLLRHLITTGAWWDVVDALATHPLRDALVADRDRITPMMRAWATADDLWLRRASVLCQIGLRQATDRELLLHTIEANLDDRSFWLRKAIGWAMRDQARHDPDWVWNQVHDWGDAISGLSRREALKHLAPRATEV